MNAHGAASMTVTCHDVSPKPTGFDGIFDGIKDFEVASAPVHRGVQRRVNYRVGTSTAIYSYGPYGELNTTSGQRFRYTGQQLIGGLGLYYYKARFYSPTLGRFLQTDPIGTADDLNLYAYVVNNPVNANDPEGLFVTQLAGGFFNASVGALVTYSTGGGTWQQYLRNAAVDFGVGALSSGVAGLSKVATLARVAGYTNTAAAKAVTAAGGEVYKGIADGKSAGEYGVSASIAGVLNSTGVVGKTAGWLANRVGAVSDGFTPNPSVAALLQPKAIEATNPAAAAGIRETLGFLPNYGLGVGAAKLSGAFGSPPVQATSSTSVGGK